MQGHQYPSEFARKNFEEGREETLRGTLRKLLALKFGELTPETEQRIATASPCQLDQFLERVLFADSISAVWA